LLPVGTVITQLTESYPVERSQAALEKADAVIRSVDVRIGKSQLRAPYDALVAARHIDEGQVIAAGVPVLSLYEDSEPEARIAIASDSVDRLRQGDEYLLHIRDRDVPATLRSVLPKREASTRSVDAIFTLSVPFNGIRRGALEAGEQVVRAGLHRLVPGQRVVARLSGSPGEWQ
jgi:multidrug efflux pump subunit AcrA (membrane-fusion protein)